MARCVLMFLLFSVFSLIAEAQDYSRQGLMEIKDQSEARRIAWVTAFDGFVQTKNHTSLPPLRQSSEQYIDQQISALRRLYAQGDGRGLLTAVNNYLQIQKQFVKDVMVSAESIKGNTQEEIDRIYQKISDFSQKEKIFLVEINNALMTEPDVEPGSQADAEMDNDEIDEPDNQNTSMIGERSKAKKKGKLPHEMEEGKKKKKSRRGQAEDE